MASGTAAGDVQFTYAQLEGLWIQASGSPQTAPIAAAIAMAESGGHSAAYDQDSNGSIDRGLWQINSVHGAQSTYDVMGNARAAVAISNNGTTWQPWVAYNNGSYRQFLRTGIPPDTNVPINATNAAANQPLTSATFVGGSCWNPLNWLGCAANAAGNAVTGAAETVAGDILGVIVDNILNPLIQLVAGVIGMTAGAGLMVMGIVFIVMGSETGRKAVGTGVGVGGLIAGQPEIAAVGAGVAGSGAAGGAQAGIRARRSTLTRQQAGSEVAARQAAQQQRILYRTTTAEQIKAQSRSYAQYQRGQQAVAMEQARATTQAARQAAMTERQRQAHRQRMSRATQRVRLAERRERK